MSDEPPRTRLTLRALAAETVAGLAQRPGRAALTAGGTILGVGALVAVLGLTATASGQISERFTLLAATEVTVEQTPEGATEYTGGKPYLAFPDDADLRVEQIDGARHAGVWWQVTLPSARRGVSALPPAAGTGTPTEGIPIYAATPNALDAMHASYRAGWGYTTFHQDREEPVVLLGKAAAAELGISRLDASPAVYIAGLPFTVIGIIDDVERNADVLLGAIVPTTTASRYFGPPDDPPKMLVETDIGAAHVVAAQVAVALRPDNAELFRVVAPPDPKELRAGVESDLNVLFLVLATVSVLVGTFGIANTTLVAVLERVPEIGLRRAVGARPRHIAVQFLAESGALGTIGGITGTTLGVLTVLTIAIAQDWTALMPVWLAATAPFIGTATGLLAGAYPAWRATRIEPADALRR